MAWCRQWHDVDNGMMTDVLFTMRHGGRFSCPLYPKFSIKNVWYLICADGILCFYCCRCLCLPGQLLSSSSGIEYSVRISFHSTMNSMISIIVIQHVCSLSIISFFKYFSLQASEFQVACQLMSALIQLAIENLRDTHPSFICAGLDVVFIPHT